MIGRVLLLVFQKTRCMVCWGHRMGAGRGGIMGRYEESFVVFLSFLLYIADSMNMVHVQYVSCEYIYI